MLRARRRTQLVAAASIFSALYAILGFVPISRLIGIGAFITFREALSPVAGMVLGPVAGGLAMVVGALLGFALGRPVVFLGFDFMIDLAAAVTAGLAFSGRRALSVAFVCIVLLGFLTGPSSPASVTIDGIPFAWMHVASVAVLGIAVFLEKRGRIERLGLVFVGSTVLASTMCGHAMGGVLTEYVYLGYGKVFGYATANAYWSAIFLVYPFERAFLAVVGTLVGVPVLRGLAARQGKPTTS